MSMGVSIRKSLWTVEMPLRKLHPGIAKLDLRWIEGSDGWPMYMEREREQLAQRADGKMTRMIGRILPGEDQDELEVLASDDQYFAQEGYVPLREGERVFYKHIDELTFSDCSARLEYEKTLVR